MTSTIQEVYDHYANTPSNCNEHFETLRKYASKCKSVIELGCSDMITTWAMAKGLSDGTGSASATWLTCVDIRAAPQNFDKAAAIAKSSGNVKMKFIQGDALKIKLPHTDMLLIDTFHSYPQLKKELEKHSSIVNKYIAILNTEVDADTSELVRMFFCYNIDEVCDHLKCTHEEVCKGLKPAIDEFLENQTTWVKVEQHTNNNGLVILERQE
jgi:hypothetical protein